MLELQQQLEKRDAEAAAKTSQDASTRATASAATAADAAAKEAAAAVQKQMQSALRAAEAMASGGGHPGGVLIEAPPGMGKSALVAEALSRHAREAAGAGGGRSLGVVSAPAQLAYEGAPYAVWDHVMAPSCAITWSHTA